MIYVVDSSDRDRMGISKSELVAMLEVSQMWFLLCCITFYCFYSKFVECVKGQSCTCVSESEVIRLVFQEEELKKAILVVFANKQDMEQAMTPTEVANSLGLPALKDRKWQIFKTSATKGTGLDEAMEW